VRIGYYNHLKNPIYKIRANKYMLNHVYTDSCREVF